jgi:nickel/cobalt transporter (NiCoT) family protein
MIMRYRYHVHGTTASLLAFAFLLGLRHGVDPDHLAAIDGVAPLRNSRWNGVWFAAGHSFVVTLLAVGIGHIDLGPLNRLTPYLLIAIGVANLMRLFRSGHPHHAPRLPSASPLILGIIFAAGFETASQISAFVLASKMNAGLLGLAFGGGMVIVDGIDGYNAAGVQAYAARRSLRGQRASTALSIAVVIMSFTLAAAALTGYTVDNVAFPTVKIYLTIPGILGTISLWQPNLRRSNKLRWLSPILKTAANTWCLAAGPMAW